MALTPPLADLGRAAPDFDLPGIDGRRWTLADVRGPAGTVVLFICNHCPFVKAVAGRLAEDAVELKAAGIGVVAIMPNDAVAYPADSFDQMKEFALEHRFGFPYLIDESQDVARAYGAVCTPDVFGYDADLKLAYRGRIDAAGRHAPAEPLRRDLVEAMREIARTGKGPADQPASIGCSIKWKA